MLNPAPQFYLTRLREQLEAAKGRLYPAGKFSPVIWLEYVEGLLHTADHYIKSAHDSDSYEDRITALSLIVAAYQMLDKLNGAGVPEVPYAIVNPLTRWFTAIDPDKSFFFRSQNRFDYEIEQHPEPALARLSYLHPSLEAISRRLKWPVEFITVPGDAFGTVLHLSLVAHEVGHVAYDRHRKVFDRRLKALCGRSRDALLSDALEASGWADIPAGLTSEILVARLPDIVGSWLEETFSDAACFFITGPAGYFSLCDMFQLSDWRHTRSHPAADIRLSLMREAMSQGNPSFKSLLQNAIGTQTWERLAPDHVLSGSPARITFEEAEVEPDLAPLIAWYRRFASKAFAAAIEVLRKKYPELEYTPKQFKRDITEFESDLLEAIPPIESGVDLNKRKPVPLTAVLNVGWLVMLSKLGEVKIKVAGDQHLRDGQTAERLNGLLLKAVELSEIRLEWETVKCQFSQAAP